MSTASQQEVSTPNRPHRIESHALLDVRKYKYLPFFVSSAVLLDISIAGFKLEFTGETRANPGDSYWISVPLQPLGIFTPERLNCKIECRWFDPQRYRMGGVFLDLGKTERTLIQQLVEVLKSRGALD